MNRAIHYNSLILLLKRYFPKKKKKVVVQNKNDLKMIILCFHKIKLNLISYLPKYQLSPSWFVRKNNASRVYS